MPFEIISALVAGFVATLVMSLMMRMATRMGMTDMPPMPLVVGSMMAGERSAARTAGMVIHFIVMGTVIFGIVYAALFSAFGTASWLTGLVIGIVHGLVVGTIGMPMMGAVHPRLEPAVGPESATVREEGGELRIANPGLFGKNWGGMTPVGLVMGHAIYGLVLAIAYGLLV